MTRFLPVLAVCALCQAATAQSVYKCSDAGKVTYTDRPCAAGSSVELKVPAAPPAAPALEQAERERATLHQLERQRAARERREDREERELARARRTLAAQRQKCDRLRLRHKWASEDLAHAPRARFDAARLRVRRQAEALAVECPA